MDNVRAVMDAVRSARVALLGMSEGGNLSVLFAFTYPERTCALVLFDVSRGVSGPPTTSGRRQALTKWPAASSTSRTASTGTA